MISDSLVWLARAGFVSMGNCPQLVLVWPEQQTLKGHNHHAEPPWDPLPLKRREWLYHTHSSVWGERGRGCLSKESKDSGFFHFVLFLKIMLWGKFKHVKTDNNILNSHYPGPTSIVLNAWWSYLTQAPPTYPCSTFFLKQIGNIMLFYQEIFPYISKRQLSFF